MTDFVFVCAGQSNMVGSSPLEVAGNENWRRWMQDNTEEAKKLKEQYKAKFDAQDEQFRTKFHNRIFAYNNVSKGFDSLAKIADPAQPLSNKNQYALWNCVNFGPRFHDDPRPSIAKPSFRNLTASPAVYFAIQFLMDRNNDDDRVYLVQTAVGGIGFVDPPRPSKSGVRWTRTDDSRFDLSWYMTLMFQEAYAALVERTEWKKGRGEAHNEVVVGGIVWLGGETDALAKNANAFEQNLKKRLLDEFRNLDAFDGSGHKSKPAKTSHAFLMPILRSVDEAVDGAINGACAKWADEFDWMHFAPNDAWDKATITRPTNPPVEASVAHAYLAPNPAVGKTDWEIDTVHYSDFGLRIMGAALGRIAAKVFP